MKTDSDFQNLKNLTL